MKLAQKISVVITTKDRHDSLLASLSSVSSQTILPAEVIIIDDGSFPVVHQSCLSILPQEIKKSIYRNKVSRGVSFSRNLAIHYSSKEFIAFLDDDDIFLPNKIEVISKLIEANPEIDLFCHRANVVMLNEGIHYRTKFKNQIINTFSELLISNWVGGASLVVCRKKILLEAGLFDEGLPACEDWDLWLRCAKHGAKIANLDNTLVNYTCVTKKTSLSHCEEKNKIAKLLIQKKYSQEIAKLSVSEKNLMEELSRIEDLQRYLINYDYGGSVLCAFRIFYNHLSIVNLLRLIVVLMGSRVSFFIRKIM